MALSGSDVDKEPFEKSPIILYESHADPITVDFIRSQLDELVEAGYTAICLEQPEADLNRAISELEKFMIPMRDVTIEDIESGANTFISEHIRKLYKEHAASFERQFKIGLEHKVMLYKAILAYQNDHNGLPKVYAIDTGIETGDDLKELAKIYETEDFDNPNFNRVRDAAFAQNIANALHIHHGGVITIMGNDHFGLQKALSKVLSEEQAKQIKSFYHYALTGPEIGSSSHTAGLCKGEDKSKKRYVLGIDVRDFSNKKNLGPQDFKEMSAHLLDESYYKPTKKLK